MLPWRRPSAPRLNHAVSFRVVGADIRQCADVLDKWLCDSDFKIRGRSVKAAPVTSLHRRRAFAAFYGLQRQLQILRREGT